jgi:murein L,D-transpeptidase YafK
LVRKNLEKVSGLREIFDDDMTLRRNIILAATMMAGLALAGCQEQGSLPRSGRHYVPISMEMQSLMQEKGMRTHAPILIRAFKKESELEVWKQSSSGEMQLLKTFPMCRWSGQLGPKVREGDRQVPEGFYSVTPGAMNPNSSFYLSFNVGYPNTYDRQLGRTGAHIMVHGDCSSMGCFAMTDKQVSDIYALTREAFAGGQTQVQLQSFPFRMTPENLAKYRNDPNIGFWKTLKTGNDHFEVTRKETKVSVCGGRYTFGRDCEGQADDTVVQAVAARQRQDETKVAELVNRGTRAVKRIYRDGDMHPTFKETLLAGQAQHLGTTRNGISRTDALAFTPIDIPVDTYNQQRAKGRTPMQIAELAQNNQLNPAPEKAAPASAEPGARPTAVASAPAQPATTAAATTTAAAPATTAAALAPKEEAPSGNVFQRMLGSAGLGGAQAEPKPADVQVEEVTPRQVNVPLPPRRQAQGAAPDRQATVPTSRLPAVVGGTERLGSSTLTSGFSKLP